MRRRPLFFLAATFLIGNGATALAQDYPQWRGQNRDGAASAFTEPKSWPESLTRRWKVEVGDGYATPILIGDTVYIFTRRAGNEVVTALSAQTGKELWHTGYPAPHTPSKAAAAHGAGPKATPLFHEGKLFLLNDDGELIVARAIRAGFETLKRYTVADSATWSQPTISRNRIFIKDVTSLTLWTID